jgi:large subunit ribosomal protein L11
MEFCKASNAKTQDKMGKIIPVEITVFADRSFTFITKTPPTSFLILEATKLKKGSPEPHKEKVGKLTQNQVKEIAEIKMPEVNASDVESAMRMIAGTARSMGIVVKG